MTTLSKRSGGGIALFLILILLSSDGFVLNPRQTHFPSCSLNIQNVLYSNTVDQTQSSSDSVSSNTQSPAPLASVDDWSAYLDESKGLLYYFNRRTGKSQWEPPDVVFPEIAMSIDKKVEMRAQLKSYLKERLNDSSKDTNIIDAMEQERARIEKKRREATEKLNAKMSKLEAIKTHQQQQQQQQQQQLQTTNNVAAESSPAATTIEQPIESKEQQQPKESDETKPTSLPIVQQGEWSAYFDIKSGLVFYYNEQTKVSLWDPPSKDFPRVIMENNIPKVLDPRTSNISMERALTMTMEEDEAKRKWEEAKEKEKARKAKLRAEKAAAEAAASAVAENAQEENIAAQKRELAAEQKRRSEEALLKVQIEEEEREKAAAAEKIAAEQQRLESERIAQEKAEQEKQQKEEEEARAMVQAKYEAAKAAELRRLEQERIDRDRKLAEAQVLLDKERLEKERAAAAAAKKIKEEEEDRKAAEQAATQATAAETTTTTKQPSRPTEEPVFTVENVENMVAPLKATDATTTAATLYDILNCPPSATRSELKRAYITLAKETHPDALLQAGIQNDEIVPDKFVEISQAWKILGDTTSRRRYDREIAAKGVSSKAGSIFENWVMGAAKKMDEALSKAEDTLEK
ncbi:hypothetical protein QTG54_001552 [Skeletonema marinoi]|uniref:DnaJ homolog subfamily C member 2 n=1 Tax=Skeletonema marinoi TaxID=267567 RepID=A0AAD8YL87_9STRA|nr:hypothetical protein QTG54_001552 [Skeletonema marinoi]